MKLIFDIPEIDRKETKEAVEKALSNYKWYLLATPEEELPRMTASYSLTPPSNTNAFHSSTEEAAIKNAHFDIERKKYIDKFVRAFNRLSAIERQVINKRYLEEDEIFDYLVFNELGLGETKYYEVKGRAIYKLAFALRLDVMKPYQ
ncbi:ArpU family phage packaging/lysis transcriptional regulator [Alkalihalobacterium alkalinitrilicum]|uniref:ArpU family phage packaging/lysis transcriptional regulator n=1 Tax=Alkalihalobacterium alkalinitrilicum TaxID=427920 RepID=UPI0009959A37|nr:ArpU family phage packaging/lysis transcriptional regulator [Alkalihalobacterium alkalinitrilicum]